MENELIFRVILAAVWILMIVTTGIRMYFSRKAGRPGENISIEGEGTLGVTLFRLFSAIGEIAVLIYLFIPDWIRWAALPMPVVLRWIGVGLIIAGVPLFFLAHYALGKSWSISVVIKEQHSLVTSGPYRWVRHPIYTAAFMFVLATFLVTANWFIGITLLGISVVVAVRAGKEEQILIEAFGDEYREYMQRTGRFLPVLRR